MIILAESERITGRKKRRHCTLQCWKLIRNHSWECREETWGLSSHSSGHLWRTVRQSLVTPPYITFGLTLVSVWETTHSPLVQRSPGESMASASGRRWGWLLDNLGSDRVKPTPRPKRGINGTVCHRRTYARGNHHSFHQQWCLVSVWPGREPAAKSHPGDLCSEIPYDTNWISLGFFQSRAGTTACTPALCARKVIPGSRKAG